MQPQDSFVFKDLFSPAHRRSLFGAFALLGAAYIVEHFANIYAFSYSLRPTSTYVGDIVLDNVPAVDLTFIIIEIALASIVLGTLFVLSQPRYVLFSLKAVALFVIIRAISISLTHVGIYPDHIAPGLGIFDSIYVYLNFQLGFFFSGHTALPLLMALIFWNKPFPRFLFIVLSFIFGVAVLLTHTHYSIDVFAAPFMAYGIFAIAKRLFPRDYKLIG